MTASVPQNGNGGPPAQGITPLGAQLSKDETKQVVQGIQELILDAIPKARGAADGPEFQKWASGIGELVLALYPKGGEIGGPGANDSAQKAGPVSPPKKGSADAGKP